MSAPVPPGFRVLFVCTANLCRSVFAERLTRHGLAVRLGPAAERFQVTSAGTGATPGRAMHPYVRDILAGREVDVAGFASRSLTRALVVGSDLVLAATGAHRDHAISLVPAALGRTFTLTEFARLVEAAGGGHGAATGRATIGGAATGGATIGGAAAGGATIGGATTGHEATGGHWSADVDLAARASGVVAGAQRMRGRVPYVDPLAGDLPDPAPTLAAFADCAAQIGAVLDPVLDALCLARRARERHRVAV